ncbi:MAG: hypothetical protein AAB874_04395, partial [Patescibacteria group bacterium]
QIGEKLPKIPPLLPPLQPAPQPIPVNESIGGGGDTDPIARAREIEPKVVRGETLTQGERVDLVNGINVITNEIQETRQRIANVSAELVKGDIRVITNLQQELSNLQKNLADLERINQELTQAVEKLSQTDSLITNQVSSDIGNESVITTFQVPADLAKLQNSGNRLDISGERVINNVRIGNDIERLAIKIKGTLNKFETLATYFNTSGNQKGNLVVEVSDTNGTNIGVIYIEFYRGDNTFLNPIRQLDGNVDRSIVINSTVMVNQDKSGSGIGTALLKYSDIVVSQVVAAAKSENIIPDDVRIFREIIDVSATGVSGRFALREGYASVQDQTGNVVSNQYIKEIIPSEIPVLETVPAEVGGGESVTIIAQAEVAARQVLVNPQSVTPETAVTLFAGLAAVESQIKQGISITSDQAERDNLRSAAGLEVAARVESVTNGQLSQNEILSDTPVVETLINYQLAIIAYTQANRAPPSVQGLVTARNAAIEALNSLVTARNATPNITPFTLSIDLLVDQISKSFVDAAVAYSQNQQAPKPAQRVTIDFPWLGAVVLPVVISQLVFTLSNYLNLPENITTALLALPIVLVATSVVFSRRAFIKVGFMAIGAAALAACGIETTPAKPLNIDESSEAVVAAPTNSAKLYSRYTSSESGVPFFNPEVFNAPAWDAIYGKMQEFAKIYYDKSPVKDNQTFEDYEMEFYAKLEKLSIDLGADFSIVLKLISEAPSALSLATDPLIEWVRGLNLAGQEKYITQKPEEAIRMFSGNPTIGILDKESIIYAHAVEASAENLGTFFSDYPEIIQSWQDLIDARNSLDTLQTGLKTAVETYLQNYPASLDFFWEETVVDGNFTQIGLSDEPAQEQLLNYGEGWLQWSYAYNENPDSVDLKDVVKSTREQLVNSDNRNVKLLKDQIVKSAKLIELLQTQATDAEKAQLDSILTARNDYLSQLEKYRELERVAYTEEIKQSANLDFQLTVAVAFEKYIQQFLESKGITPDQQKPQTIWWTAYAIRVMTDIGSAFILAQRELVTPSHTMYDFDNTLNYILELAKKLGIDPMASKNDFINFYNALKKLEAGTETTNIDAQNLYQQLNIPAGQTGWYFGLKLLDNLFLNTPVTASPGTIRFNRRALLRFVTGGALTLVTIISSAQILWQLGRIGGEFVANFSGGIGGGGVRYYFNINSDQSLTLAEDTGEPAGVNQVVFYEDNNGLHLETGSGVPLFLDGVPKGVPDQIVTSDLSAGLMLTLDGKSYQVTLNDEGTYSLQYEDQGITK